MSRTFDGIDDLLEQSSAPVVSTPFSYSFWFNRPDLDVSRTAVAIDTISANELTACYCNTASLIFAFSRIQDGTTAQASKGDYLVNTWEHGAFVFSNNASRIAYLNGIAGTVDNANIPVATVDHFCIGSRYLSGILGGFWEGELAEVAVWDIALSQSEITILAAGWSPRHVRPQSLKAYVPIIRDTQNLKSGPMTVTGTVAAEHPRIFY